jgi:hypothetical protein
LLQLLYIQQYNNNNNNNNNNKAQWVWEKYLCKGLTLHWSSPTQVRSSATTTTTTTAAAAAATN